MIRNNEEEEHEQPKEDQPSSLMEKIQQLDKRMFHNFHKIQKFIV